MADKNDDALANTAVALNEDAKAARKRKSPTDAAKAHLGTADADLADDDVGGALAGLGAAIDANTDPDAPLDLSEGAHVLAVERMEQMAIDAVVKDRNLIAFARDFMLDQIKARPKPWSATSNAEQRDVAAAAEIASHELIRKIVEAHASFGKGEPIRVLLTKVTMGDDIVIAGKVKTFAEDEALRAVISLHAAHGKHVMLTVASTDDYNGGPEAEIEDDQRDLGFQSDQDER